MLTLLMRVSCIPSAVKYCSVRTELINPGKSNNHSYLLQCTMDLLLKSLCSDTATVFGDYCSHISMLLR